MRFGLRALLMITIVTAVWFALLKQARPVAFLIFALAAFNALALPAIIVLIGLTSRQKGSSLDVKSNQTFMSLLTVWLISVSLCCLFYLASWLQDALR